MANTIDWGQAAVNNTNGFGKAPTNNTIDFGEVCADSWSPETNLTGAGATPSFENTKSILLGGIDDYVNMGNPASLQITGNLTLSAWIKKDASATSSNYMIIGKDGVTGGTRSYSLLVNSSTNKAQFNIWKSATAYTLQGTTTILAGVWYHIMGVNNGTDTKIYVNGTLENTNVGGGGTIDNGVTDLNIGRRTTSPATRGYWKGNIDEVAVWNSDQSSIASAIGSSPVDLSTYSPLSWWRCGDGDTAPTLTDNGSGGNDGTMESFSTFSTDVPT